MAKEYVADLTQVDLVINGQTQKYDFGGKEAFYFPATLNDAVLRSQVTTLAQLRARFLPKDFTIVNAVSTRWADKNKTMHCLDTPLDGAYPPEARNALNAANVTIPAGANGTVPTGNDNTVITIDLTKPFVVNSAENCSWFRLEGDNYAHSNRYFAGLPDLFISDYAPQNIPGGVTWVDPADVPADPTVRTADALYWLNFKDFWTWVKKYTKLVQNNDNKDETKSPTAYPWMLCGISRVMFKGLTRRPAGRPSGGPRGRAPIAS